MGRPARMLLALVAAAGGCSSWVQDDFGGQRHLQGSFESGRKGTFVERFLVEEGETALLVTLDAESPFQGVFLEFEGPKGRHLWTLEEEWDVGRLKTGARYSSAVVSLNWPILEGDAALLPGRYRLEMGTVGDDPEYVGHKGALVDILFKEDDDFTGGAVTVSLVFVGTTVQDGELARAVDEALALWSDLYAIAGIELEVLSYEAPDVESLPAPGRGAGDTYEAIAQSVEPGSIPVLLVPTIEDGEGIFGVSGGIPGPLVATARTGIVVSAITNSGPDLLFDAEEERLLAETFAHETLHYLGLFHPVEGSWDKWDALDDTPECKSELACVNQFAANLMFPWPICDNSGCVPQDELTDDQIGVANRYTGVR